MRRVVLPLILTLAFILRVFWLDKYPVGFTPDEASFGYDAYSILQTGKDQWGQPFPIVLESFGDYKSPLYAYLTVPSVAIFGLTKFAVRLPNAILGTLAVLVTYFLSKKLFEKKFEMNNPLRGRNLKLEIAAALLLAISPWHIMLSRGAFEANLTTFFLPLGILLFLKEKFWLAGIVLGLNLFSYHSAKFMTPLVLIAIIVYTKQRVKKYWPALATFGIFLTLTFYTFFLGGGARIGERSITQGALEASFEERTRSSSLFHNKYQIVAKRFFSNYVSYVSPQFFFTEGTREGTYGMIPGRGVLYWSVIPFFIGVRKLFYQDKYKRELLLLAFWVFASPIPAALASGVGHSANRVAAMMPAFEILLALGAMEFFGWLRNRKILLYGFCSLVLIFFISFMEDYFIQSPYKIGKSMLYGNLEVADWVAKNAKGKDVVVDRSLSEPHIYFAFAEKFAPGLYQNESRSWNYREQKLGWLDQLGNYSLGKYTFKDINQDDYKNNALLVGRPEDFLGSVIPLKTFVYPDGSPAVLVVDPNAKTF